MHREDLVCDVKYAEDLVCDVKYAEKLVELGFNRKSWFSYVKLFKGYNFEEDEFMFEDEYVAIESFTDSGIRYKGDKLPTFTTDELLEMFPRITGYSLHTIKTRDSTGEYIVGLYSCGVSECLKEIRNKKLSNALAKLLIWCIENGYVEKESDEI